jgi:hypothetical protein
VQTVLQRPNGDVLPISLHWNALFFALDCSTKRDLFGVNVWSEVSNREEKHTMRLRFHQVLAVHRPPFLLTQCSKVSSQRRSLLAVLCLLLFVVAQLSRLVAWHYWAHVFGPRVRLASLAPSV